MFARLKGMALKQLVCATPEEAGGCTGRGSSEVLGDGSPRAVANKGTLLVSAMTLEFQAPHTDQRLPAAGFGWKSHGTTLHKHLSAFQPTGVLCASSLPLSMPRS